MSEAVLRARKTVVERVLHGPAATSGDLRRAAFDNLGVPGRTQLFIDKVARHAYRVTDEDVTAAQAAGASDDELFELAICAALGQSTRQLEAALAVIELVPDAKPRR